MKVVINRAKWNSAHRLNAHESKLLLTDTRGNCRCCLGFLGAAVGASDDQLVSHCYPRTAESVDWPSGLFGPSSWQPTDTGRVQWETFFAVLNDTAHVDDATRESWIAEGFRIVLGCEVEFVGEYGEVAR